MHTVLRNALVVDGTGGPARQVDVELLDGRIGAIGELPVVDGESIDLSGLVLAPGFIDIHTHLDAQVFWDPDLTPSSWHGVTTAVLGNCGFGIAPTAPEDRDVVMDTLELVEGMNARTLRAGIDWCFETFPEYLAALRRLPKRINVASVVPHSMVRTFVMGSDAATSRTATDDELARMGAIVDEAFAAGALGFSSSQAPSHMGAHGRPVPSRLADRRELLALLARVAASGRGIAEVTYGPLLDIEEVALISKDLGVRITWGSLLTGLFGEPGAAMEMLERASAVGGDIWPQVSCREIVFQMSLLSPYFFSEVAGFNEVMSVPADARAKVYADPVWRDRARSDVERPRPGAYDRISIEETRAHPELVGRTMASVANERGVHPFDLMLDLALQEDLSTRFRVVSRNDEPVEHRALVTDRRTILGAHDAGAHLDMVCDAGYPSHLLGHWVRDQQALSLEAAVWRLSGQLADVFRLTDRGFIRTGLAADLVAFDPATVTNLPNERVWDFPAHTDRLISHNRGIEDVWVAGRLIQKHGVPVSGATPGALVSA
jgi:N-acyl-D-aspartate/D-glutamate deacylase